MTTGQGWQPGIGDPTIAGWITVFAYFLACFLCWKAAKNAVSSWAKTGDGRSVFFWISFSAMLLLLGINKQLDIQTWFTEIGRDLSKAHGWYEQRHFVQIAFIILFATCGIALLTFFLRLTRAANKGCRIALIGGVFLVCFVIMRAASFHHVDQLLGFRLGGIRMNSLLELGGIACIGLGAWKFIARRPRWPAAVSISENVPQGR